MGTPLPAALTEVPLRQHLERPAHQPRTAFVQVHLRLALAPPEGAVCLEMKFFKFNPLSLWGLLFFATRYFVSLKEGFLSYWARVFA